MNQPNFRCPKTGKKFFFPKYRMFIKNGNPQYFSEGVLIVSPDNGEILEKITHEGNYTITIGSSKAVEKDKMIKHFRNRSKEHFKKEVAPVKAAMIRSTLPSKGEVS